MDEPVISRVGPPQPPVDVPEALREPTRSKNLLFMGLYMIANMTTGVGNITIGTILLAKHIAVFVPADQTSQTSIYSLIQAVGAAMAILTALLVGMLSDRTISRWGRRRPWYLVGGGLTVLSLLAMSNAPSLLVLTIAFVALEVGINMLRCALNAIIPDQVPLSQRATVSALANGPGTLLGAVFGQMLVARFFTTIPAGYTSLAVSVTIMALLFLLVFRDAPLPREHRSPLRAKQILTMLNPLSSREFLLVWLSRCLLFLGYITTDIFLFFYLRDVIHYDRLFPGQTIDQGVQTLFAIITVALIVASLVGGIISDKLQRRKPLVIIASIIVAMGLSLYAFFPIWSMVLVGCVLLGIGMGIYMATDFALATQVLPAATDRGKDIGIIHTATYVPIFLSPVIAGITLSILHSYLALFALLAVAGLMGAVLIIPIKSIR